MNALVMVCSVLRLYAYSLLHLLLENKQSGRYTTGKTGIGILAE
jgi:hypothetical protein